mgnify:CR=1 FL=1
MIVSSLIKASLRKIGALSVGEDIAGGVSDDLLQALQVMLRSWAQKRILVYASKKESFSTVPGQSLYTWGSGGNITTARPHQIIFAFIRDANGTDIYIESVSEGRYNNISTKTTSGRPLWLFYHPEYPLGNLYFYPTPSVAETVWINSLKPFTETSSFENVDQTIAFPPNYEEALIYNLAIRIAPEMGISVSAELMSIADRSYSALIGLNSSNAIETISPSLPVGMGYRYSGGGRYNINQG